jgi:predicted GNAT superfamily acetyltransferase
MAEEIEIRLARNRPDFDACALLQRAVWGLSETEITSPLHLITSIHAGGMLHLAENAESRPVGFAFASPGLRDGLAYFHADLLAVLPEHRQRGVGVRLKWAQREEALGRGITLMMWTDDPLQARNANLNLRRLGGVAAEFLADFYGVAGSSLHHGLPTDRVLVRWDLSAPRVEERARSGEPLATVATPALPRINDVRWQAGWPVSSEPRLELTEPELLLEIPPEWDVLCQAAPRLAQDWHGKVCRALSAYMGRGWIAADFAPTEESGRRRPFYVLRKD